MESTQEQEPQLLEPELIEAEEASRDLRLYVELSWPVLEPETVFVPNWHIDAICDHLAAVSLGEIRNLLITVPPRHGKSLLCCVFWPSWVWLQEPAKRWLFTSYAHARSVADAVKCRRLIESDWYQARYGWIYSLVGDQNEKVRYENSRTGIRIATSFGGASTGEGGDFIICDDPHKIEEAESHTVRESTVLDWDQVLSQRMNDPKTTARVIIMQRVHEADLGGHVLKQGGYEHLNLPTEYEPTRLKWKTRGITEDPRREPGELLNPDRFSPVEIADAKIRLGSYGFAAQHQQRPAPAGGGILKREWWRYYRQPPDEFDEILQSWDLAFKDLRMSSFVVGQVWARKGADKFLLDQVRGKFDFPATLVQIRNLSTKHPDAGTILIEDRANGPAVISTLESELSGLLPVEPSGSKESRAYAVSPQCESGNVYLPDVSIAPWVIDFVDECTAFPRGANNDQVDAATQALFILQRRERTRSGGGARVVRTTPAWVRRQMTGTYRDPRYG